MPNGRASGRGSSNSVILPPRRRPRRWPRSSREPRRPVRRHGEGGEPRDRRGNGELLDPSAGDPTDLVRGDLEEINGAVGSDGDVAETALPGRHVECRCLAVAERSARACSRSEAWPIPRHRALRRRRTAPRPRESSRVSVPTTWRVKRPSFRRVTLITLGSANHTAPSGPTAQPPELRHRRRQPERVDGCRRAKLGRCVAVGASVYQARPSASTARPSGSMLSAPFGILSICPLRSRPMCVGRFEREPDRSVAGRRDGDRDVGPARQSDLLECDGVRRSGRQANSERGDEAERDRRPRAMRATTSAGRPRSRSLRSLRCTCLIDARPVARGAPRSARSRAPAIRPSASRPASTKPPAMRPTPRMRAASPALRSCCRSSSYAVGAKPA